DYGRVLRLKQARPELPIAVNGGIAKVDAAADLIGQGLDGAMLGRAAYADPAILLTVDPVLFGEPAPVADPFEALEAFLPYV
ncbi:tRNA-dihydrouridine synthase, partial [Proteus mirabilis]|uniref:tRNA-dihydrouridine synthase n=1 Tax=Proteus mirabilis TaxID=584 RepID=UPI001952C581